MKVPHVGYSVSLESRSNGFRSYGGVILLGAFLLASLNACRSVPSSVDRQRVIPKHIKTTLPSSFPAAENPQHHAWRPFIGIWAAIDGDVQMLLTPRKPRAGRDGAHGTLFGAIPDGPLEGAIVVDHPAAKKKGSPRLSIQGKLYRADKHITHSDLQLIYDRSLQSLELHVAGRSSVHLKRISNVNHAALARVRIIGHRGLGVGGKDFQNSLHAFRNAWNFGCSGVEFDVTIPYTKTEEGKIPHVSEMRVGHPPELRAELGFDIAPLKDIQNRPTVAIGLAELQEHHIPFVYIDTKLTWLLKNDPAGAQRSLDQIVNLAFTSLAKSPDQRIALGAEKSGVDQTADLLEKLCTEPGWQQARLSWTPENTKGTEDSRFWRFFTRASKNEADRTPAISSYSLLRLPGSGQGVLGLLLPDISKSWLELFDELKCPVILWTARNDKQFGHALRMVRRFDQSHDEFRREVGIMSPYPHRLAYYLATRSAGHP